MILFNSPHIPRKQFQILELLFFWSKQIFASFKIIPAVHYIPTRLKALAFGDAVSIGATKSAIFFK